MYLRVLALTKRPRDAKAKIKGQKPANTEARGLKPADTKVRGQRVSSVMIVLLVLQVCIVTAGQLIIIY